MKGGNMKKFLYGTTALAAVGLVAGQASAAEPLHAELGGYYQQAFGFTDVDSPTDQATTSNYQNAEVYFKMRGELDNGLKVGGRIELEGTQSGDQIDQAYLILAGGFGSVRIGAINSGRYSYGWNTDSPQVGVPINSGWVSVFIAPTTTFYFRQPGASTVIDASNDAQKLTYFTPRFSGFQFTASWTPTSDGDANGGNGGESTGPVTEGRNYTNAFDLGVSYSGEFNGVGVEAQAGYALSTASTVASNANVDDYSAFNGGLAVSYQGLSAAASFAIVADGLAFSCTSSGGGTFTTITSGATVCYQDSEGTAFSAGVGYSTGPYGVSVAYFQSENEGFTFEHTSVGVGPDGGDETNTLYSVAASYDLGGVGVDVTYLHAEYEGDLFTGDNEGDALVLRVGLGF
jgi:hypothetical protein